VGYDWDALLRWIVPVSFTVGVVAAVLWRKRQATPPDGRLATLRTVVAIINGGLLGVVAGVLVAVLVVAVTVS
jgi:hypothetical protein